MTVGKAGHGDFAVGLDVGTTKICAMCGDRQGEMMRIISVATAPSHGLRKGIVVEMERTADSVKRAVNGVEDSIGVKVRSVIVGIAGGHIKGFDGHGAIAIKGVVREDDVDRLLDSASAVCVPVDREVLHVIPGGFRIDGDNGIRDPLGMSGERLEGRVHIVTGALTSVQSLMKCCEMAGLEVSDIVLEPLASADAVVSKEEKERGVVLVDIGGGTTDIAIYREGILRHTAVLALGGNHLTNDLSVGLGIPVEEAERIKKAFGYTMTGMTDEREEVEVSDGKGATRRVAMRFITRIIEPRCEELMTLVKKEMDSVAGGVRGTPGTPPFGGVVLTGGTSLLKGIDLMGKFIFRLPVRIGIPEGVENGGLVNSPEYATGVGLLSYGLEHQGRDADLWSEKTLTPGGIFERMKYWVKGYLNK
jgi:cell division protein FtsA